ncbi:MAG: cobalamin-binding protein [Myxococcales bacterium]|nr:cobalamin-binding protein [Myxococcales bacterium]
MKTESRPRRPKAPTAKRRDAAPITGPIDGLGPARRIVCLTAETTEIVFALGAGDRVVGVSGYAVRPPEARKKPKVAAYTSIKFEKILALKPDLVLAFSDLQKDVVRQLVGAGLPVFTLNQRSLAETLNAILWIGMLIGEADRARALVDEFTAEIAAAWAARPDGARRPVVYFEEWDEPLITGIRWVGELIEAAGGVDAFEHLRLNHRAPDRVIQSEDVVARRPDIIVASWCGKKANLTRIKSRAGWDQIPAVRHGRVHEIKSPDILQPGPSLLHGLRLLRGFIDAWRPEDTD